MVPGSHTLGVKRRFCRRFAGSGDSDGDASTKFDPPEAEAWDLEGAVPVEVGSGALVLLHSAVVHYSSENTSPDPRHAYSIHVVDGKEGVIYPIDNWLQRPPEFPFREIEM